MKSYARIENGVVAEVFPPIVYDEDVYVPGTPAQPPTEENPEGTSEGAPVLVRQQGEEIPIEARFHPDFVAALVLVPDGATVTAGDSFDGTTFGPPPPLPVPPPPTAADVMVQRDALLAVATVRIAPLQDAVDLDEATPAEVAALKAWKQYRVLLSRIEQQPGFPAAVDWPKAPA